VLGQTFEDFELIIIDDMSTDDSNLIIRNFALFDERVVPMITDLEADHHNIKCNRYAHNINQAFKSAKGKYISYLCDDDFYLPYRLEVMNRYLDRNTKVDIVYGQQICCDHYKEGLKITHSREVQVCVDQASFRIDHSSVLHRREVFEKVGGWDENLKSWRVGDAAFWVKLNDAGYKFYLVGEYPTDVHRYNELSVSYALDHNIKELPYV
jgi:glycosyltransferase involved in cell wall biosynthesis